MKNLLTQQNLMWAAIAVLSFVAYNASQSDTCEDCSKMQGMRNRMSQMSRGMNERMGGSRGNAERGSRGDTGRGRWNQEDHKKPKKDEKK